MQIKALQPIKDFIEQNKGESPLSVGQVLFKEHGHTSINGYKVWLRIGAVKGEDALGFVEVVREKSEDLPNAV